MLDKLISWAIPLVIPVLLVASWLCNHKTSGGHGSRHGSTSSRSAGDQKHSEGLSDDQMTSG